jgi:hypothetical protein
MHLPSAAQLLSTACPERAPAGLSNRYVAVERRSTDHTSRPPGVTSRLGPRSCTTLPPLELRHGRVSAQFGHLLLEHFLQMRSIRRFRGSGPVGRLSGRLRRRGRTAMSAWTHLPGSDGIDLAASARVGRTSASHMATVVNAAVLDHARCHRHGRPSSRAIPFAHRQKREDRLGAASTSKWVHRTTPSPRSHPFHRFQALSWPSLRPAGTPALKRLLLPRLPAGTWRIST